MSTRPPVDIGDSVVITRPQHRHQEQTGIVEAITGVIATVQLVDDTQQPFIPIGIPFDIHIGSILRIPSTTEQNARKTHLRAKHFEEKKATDPHITESGIGRIRVFKQFDARSKRADY